MYRKKPDVDVILDILKAARAAYPASVFIESLLFQYQERGGLSKKQLEGLHKKTAKMEGLPANWTATLEAEILKRPNRYKSGLPPAKPLYIKEEKAGLLIDAVLARFPQHKRVLFFKAKYDNNEKLSPAEMTELEKFEKLAKR